MQKTAASTSRPLCIRCENGLVVEKDVFITKDELLKCIWENGFSQNEINAFEVAFPSDYKFHYPGMLCSARSYRDLPL